MRLNIDSVNISGSTSHHHSHKIQIEKTLEHPRKKPALIEVGVTNSKFSQVASDLKSKLGNIKFNWILVASPLAVIIVLSGYYKYSLVNAQYSNSLTECRNILSNAKDKGVNVNDLNCGELKLNILNYLVGFDYTDTEKNQQLVDKKIQDITDQTTNSEKEIENTKKQLEQLLVDYTSQIQQPKYDDNLGVRLNQKQSYLESLKKLLEKSIPKIDEELKKYTDLVSQLTTADQKQAQTFLQKYNQYNQQEKIQNFSAITLETEKLQKIVQSYPPKTVASSSVVASPADLAKFKIFTGAEFQSLYESTSYEKVEGVASPAVITADKAADEYIYKFAENRGYKRRAQAVESELVAYQGQRLQTQIQLALQALQQEAQKSNIKIGLVSGYRSVSDQLGIFKSRFEDSSKAKIGRTFTVEEITTGQADKVLDSVLQTSSVPGYSRHHNGYTIDISDSTSKNSFTLFKNTSAFKWISANNYLNAKRFGFIPSYPPGQQLVGPNPEEWEFVWVGVDQLLN